VKAYGCDRLLATVYAGIGGIKETRCRFGYRRNCNGIFQMKRT
jgi:hypothetical protein